MQAPRIACLKEISTSYWFFKYQIESATLHGKYLYCSNMLKKRKEKEKECSWASLKAFAGISMSVWELIAPLVL